jgi:hypothetical protein
MNDHTIRYLADERVHQRVVEAQHERLAAQLRNGRNRTIRLRFDAAMLGHLLAFRRHATQ